MPTVISTDGWQQELMVEFIRQNEARNLTNQIEAITQQNLYDYTSSTMSSVEYRDIPGFRALTRYRVVGEDMNPRRERNEPRTDLGTWRFMDGTTKKMIEMTRPELKQALLQLTNGDYVQGQESKIISIRKEFGSRPLPAPRRQGKSKVPKVVAKKQSWPARIFNPRKIKPRGGR